MSETSHASTHIHTRRLKYHAGSSASARRCHRSSCFHDPSSSRLYSSVSFGATADRESGVGVSGVAGSWGGRGRGLLTEEEKVVLAAVG